VAEKSANSADSSAGALDEQFSGRQQLSFEPKEIRNRKDSIFSVFERLPISLRPPFYPFFFPPSAHFTAQPGNLLPEAGGSTPGTGREIAEARDIYVLISSRALNPNAPETGGVVQVKPRTPEDYFRPHKLNYTPPKRGAVRTGQCN